MKEKRVRSISKVYPYGAIKTVIREGEWVLFPTTSASFDEYPVQFQMKNIPELIKWLQSQLTKKESGLQQVSRPLRLPGNTVRNHQDLTRMRKKGMTTEQCIFALFALFFVGSCGGVLVEKETRANHEYRMELLKKGCPDTSR
jgi:hypothetical protein